jgi:hypothetical protein
LSKLRSTSPIHEYTGLVRHIAELRKGAFRARERNAGDAAILVHAAHQLLDAIELELVPGAG